MKSENSRRAFLKGIMTASVGLPVLGRAAELCKELTPVQPEGPFYPEPDSVVWSDADLTRIDPTGPQAAGRVIFVSGVVTDQKSCQPVAGALVEIWQACSSGRYSHSQDPNPAPLDPHFQYYGKMLTDSQGKYSFKTILPGAYPAGDNWIRPPHIHFKVQKLGFHELITQMYFAGQSLNSQDLILKKLTKVQQEQVIVELKGESRPTGVFNISLMSVR